LIANGQAAKNLVYLSLAKRTSTPRAYPGGLEKAPAVFDFGIALGSAGKGGNPEDEGKAKIRACPGWAGR
jgi:hypothetical protein